MPRIFLSYRRQDSAGVAGRIYDRLRAHFGDDGIFMDIDSIPFGLDFREHVNAAVDQCGVLLAVIGRNWAGETGVARRIHDPRDFVRIEIEAALERNLPVIPILIDHAKMPGEADLPRSLARLAFCNAIDVDAGRDFHPHVDRLIRGIEFHFQKSSATTAKRPRQATIPTAGPESSPSSPVKKRTNSLGMTLVRIEPGSFLMGSPKDRIDHLLHDFPDSERRWFADQQPQHAVKITHPFYLGIHPVTQGQYQAVMGDNPSHFQGIGRPAGGERVLAPRGRVLQEGQRKRKADAVLSVQVYLGHHSRRQRLPSAHRGGVGICLSRGQLDALSVWRQCERARRVCVVHQKLRE